MKSTSYSTKYISYKIIVNMSKGGIYYEKGVYNSF